MKPEDKARQEIDRQLQACGWAAQDRGSLNIHAGPGVAVRSRPRGHILHRDRAPSIVRRGLSGREAAREYRVTPKTILFRLNVTGALRPVQLASRRMARDRKPTRG